MEDSFQNNKAFLTGLVEGRIISVTYYSQNSPVTDVQTKEADLIMPTRDDVHISWMEIRNFELRLTSEMNYEYQDESNTSILTGEAAVLPGFSPRIGDNFLYMVRNGKIGIFTVSDVVRVALGQDTYHKIRFTMEEFLTATRRDQFKRQSSVWYFDKTKFLVGNTALLSTEGFVQQKDLKHLRMEIIANYMERFYSEEFSSFMRPDKVFDPYIVEFWNKKVSYNESTRRPLQLLISVANYNRTIWSVLTMNPIKNLKNVERYADTDTLVSTFWGVNITSLLGHKFVTVAGEPASSKRGGTDISDAVISSSSTTTFHGTTWEKEIRAQADKAFDLMRHQFYKHLPHQKCAPHQHPADKPQYCSPDWCTVCDMETHRSHRYIVPPYPVVSTEDLFKYWTAMRKFPEDYVPTDTDMAQFRGYVVWYREIHAGTLSAKELEADWRNLGNIEEDELTEEQCQALKEYIYSYRAQYPPVWTNREIEYKWRLVMNVPLQNRLVPEGIRILEHIQKQYRSIHGDVPLDMDNYLPEGHWDNGDSFTQEEIDLLRNKEEPLPDYSYVEVDTIPRVFHPVHPRPHHEQHCHSTCHLLCGPDAEPKNKVNNPYGGPTYALSAHFYDGSFGMDPFEDLLYKVVTNKEFKVADVVMAVSSYLDWPNDLAFYRHLFSLYLIDKALHWLRFHS